MKHTSISKTEDLISNLKVPCRIPAKAFNNARKLNPNGLGCLRRDRVETLALQQVHAVQPKRADLNERLAGCGDGLGDLVHKEGRCRAFAALDS